jgi:hypothetical protein
VGRWLARGIIERDKEMVQAHREMYEGRQLFKAGKNTWQLDGTPPESVLKLRSGMQKFEHMLERFEALKTEAADELVRDDNLIEEAMLAIMYYQAAYQFAPEPLPDNYPLKKIWDTNQDRVDGITREFDRDLGGRANN